MTAIILVAGLTLFASFLCSLLEAALYAITPSQLESMRERGVLGATRFARFRSDIEEPIAAILTINTISHTVGAAVTGAMVGTTYGDAAVGWFAGIFTFLILLLTEIVPKSVGVRFAPTLVPYLAWPLQLLIWVSWPFARPAKLLMRKMTSGATVHGPDEREVIALARMALRAGQLSTVEARWVENAIRLESVTAEDLMTPRTVVQSIRADRTVAEVFEQVREIHHSRLPAYEGDDPDALIGVVHRIDVYNAVTDGQVDREVREFVRPIDYVPEGMKAPRLLETFLHARRHLVAVLDEYGGFEGIVTLEDVLEAILGQEIVDEQDEYVDMQELARRRAIAAERVRGDRGAPPAV